MPTNKWMCTHCGRRTSRSVSSGRPLPGKCSRKEGNRPHSWVKNN
ncbi:hypothetical protein [Haloplasma contractile]|uniref:Uncharacterized protein n=1 Tax=Haloplasma contractile SSD-17B TaxID=1033810 RepID=F7Q2N0_9MOLU|nr:hypothetical protein [Haloplasma contractile]ERJ12742.1 hypothetical protein HLPCO_001082 [Haloplasma contractile SSD-17B]